MPTKGSNLTQSEKETHKVHLWFEPDSGWHYLHNFGHTSHEHRNFESRDAALAAAKKDLYQRVHPEESVAEVVEVSI